MQFARILSLCLFALMLAAPVALAEQVDNPAYQAWARFGVGSSQTMHTSMQAEGQSMEMQSTKTLVEKAADHVVIEIKSTMSMMGQEHTAPAHKLNVPAQIEKKDVTELGNEDVQAAGKTFSCKVFKIKGLNSEHPEDVAKVWVASEVPGGIVKMQVNTHRGNVTSLLQSYEAK